MECDTLGSRDYCLFRVCFPRCSSRGSSLSFMKTGGRHWSARAARFSVCWTSKGTTSLCWTACLRTSRPDRFTYVRNIILNVAAILITVQHQHPHSPRSPSPGLLGSGGYRCGLCRLEARALQTRAEILPQQTVRTHDDTILGIKAAVVCVCGLWRT